jgi:hypothetical protein
VTTACVRLVHRLDVVPLVPLHAQVGACGRLTGCLCGLGWWCEYAPCYSLSVATAPRCGVPPPRAITPDKSILCFVPLPLPAGLQPLLPRRLPGGQPAGAPFHGAALALAAAPAPRRRPPLAEPGAVAGAGRGRPHARPVGAGGQPSSCLALLRVWCNGGGVCIVLWGGVWGKPLAAERRRLQQARCQACCSPFCSPWPAAEPATPSDPQNRMQAPPKRVLTPLCLRASQPPVLPRRSYTTSLQRALNALGLKPDV